MIGQRLSHYRIIEPIGSGGMGIVYRAFDERLSREVALKVLPPELLGDEVSRKRFRAEALALSRFAHPRIGVIHDFDSEAGVDFLIMELVPGSTLADLIRSGPLPDSEVIQIGVQIAEALEAAHERGILHGDLKPGNVMVTPRGDVKVLDFGLARRFRSGEAGATTTTMTEAGLGGSGTVPYMAPEQLSEGSADGRSDLWALGVVLYEAATGRRPFAGATPMALAGEILHRDPRRPRSLRRSIPPRLEAIVLRCLAKAPGDRYPSARDVLADLRGLEGGREARIGPRWFAVPILAIAVVIGVAVARLTGAGCQGSAPTHQIASIAVLPLENLSGDSGKEFFVDGMTDEITTALAQIGALRVISRTSAMQFKGKRPPLRVIARKLNVDAIVQGTVREEGDTVRISAQLVDAAADRYLWAENFQRAHEGVLALQNEIARAIAERIRVQITPGERERLAASPVINAQAHEAYLRGRYYYNQSLSEASFRQALAAYKEAIAIDPTYAQAYAGIAEAYTQLSSTIIPAREAMPKAEAAARRALEIDSTLGAAQASLAYVEGYYNWNWKEAERRFRNAAQLGPNEAAIHQNYGLLLNTLGMFAKADSEFQRAAVLDPLSPFIGTQQLYPLYSSRRYDETIVAANKVLEADSGAAHARFIRAQAYLGRGDRDTAYREIEHAYSTNPQPLYLAYLRYIEAIGGQRSKALAALRELEHPSSGRFVQPYIGAILSIGLGDKDGAFRWIGRGIDERSEETAYLNVDPIMEPLRSDPRYAEMIRRIGVESR